MRALRALKSAGWRVARRALEVPVRIEWRAGRWHVECARPLARGRWYLLDFELAEAGGPPWQGALQAEHGDTHFHARLEGARSKSFLYCDSAVRALALRPPSDASRVSSLRLVRVPRAVALDRVLQLMRRHLPQRTAARWQRVAAERGAKADASVFSAYCRALTIAGSQGVMTTPPKRVAGAARGTRRALCIDQLLPRPDRDAGSYAAVEEMRLLKALGFELAFAAEREGGDAAPLQELGVEVLAPQRGDPAHLLRDLGPGLELVYMTRHHVARGWIDALRRHAPQAKLVLNVADLHFLRRAREAALFADDEALRELEQARREELEVLARVDQVLCYSQTEIALLQALGVPPGKVSRCPWVAEVAGRTPGFAAREGIAFLGNYAHPPNADAALHFALEIVPLLRRRRGGIPFLIYGSNVTPEVRALHGPDVEVRGHVPDVASAYDGCRVFVAPLRYGAGLKGKVVTALARGTPSVLSPVAAEGLFYLSGAEAAIAETPRQWVDQVLAYYEDEALWQRCSEAAREFARRTFSFERGLELMAQALRRCGLALP